jgi:hypothetical protein
MNQGSSSTTSATVLPLTLSPPQVSLYEVCTANGRPTRGVVAVVIADKCGCSLANISMFVWLAMLISKASALAPSLRVKMSDHSSIIFFAGPAISHGPGISNNICTSESDGSLPILRPGYTWRSRHRKRAVSCFLYRPEVCLPPADRPRIVSSSCLHRRNIATSSSADTRGSPSPRSIAARDS